MELLVISPQKSIQNEIEIVIAMFEAGLKIYHIRKPNYSTDKMELYLSKIPKKYHSRIVLHSCHKLALKYDVGGIHLRSKFRNNSFKMWYLKRFILAKRKKITVSTSFHKIANLEIFENIYNYVFLSPVFDSISKKDYQRGFNDFSLKNALQKTQYKVYALGGVELSNINRTKELGFGGCALLGSVWTSDTPLRVFTETWNLCNQLEEK